MDLVLNPPNAQTVEGVISVKDRGAVGDGVTDDRPAIQLAINAAANGGTVLFPPGTYLLDSVGPLTLPVDRTGNQWLNLSGYGAKILIGPNMPASDRGFLKPRRTADYQTLAYVLVEGFEIDGNQLNALSSAGLRGGNIFRSSGVDGQRLNIHDLIFRDIYSYGVAKPSTYNAGTGTFNNQTHLYVASKHVAQAETQTTIRRVLVDRVRMESGVHGVFVGGNVDSGTGCEVYYDDITVRSWSHDFLETQTHSTGSHVQIGSHGFGDRCLVANGYGKFGNDTGVEIDAAMSATVRDVIVEDCRTTAFFIHNFHTPAAASRQTTEFDNCKSYINNVIPDNTAPSAGGYPCQGIAIGNTGFQTGTVTVRDFQAVSTTAALNGAPNTGRAISMSGTAAKRVIVDGLHVEELNTAPTNLGSSAQYSPIYFAPTPDATDRMQLVLRNVYVKATGAPGTLSAAITYSGIYVACTTSGEIDLTIDDYKLDISIGNNANLAWYGARLGGLAGTTMRGIVRRFRIINGGGTSGGTGGLRIGSTANLTITSQIAVEFCDFTNVQTNGAELVFDATSNAAKVVVRDCVNKASTAVASATTVTLPPSGNYFTVTGTTTITSVTASFAGREVTLNFGGALTFTDGSNLLLAGNFVTTADDTITLVCDGVNWIEKSRSVN